MLYSYTQSKNTPMTYQDKMIVGMIPFTDNAYFSSLNAFTINKALREASNMSGDTEKNVRSVLKGYGIPQTDIDATIKTIQTMDKNMQPLDNDIKTVRFLDNAYLKGQKAQDLAGKTFLEPGYLSSTYDVKGSMFNIRPIQMNLNIKAGTKAIFSPITLEPELVVSRNSKYRITNVKTNSDGSVIIDADILTEQ